MLTTVKIQCILTKLHSTVICVYNVLFSLRIGRFATLGVLYGCDTLTVCRTRECRFSEMVEFLNSDREHMQRGVFPDVQQSYFLHSALKFNEVSWGL